MARHVRVARGPRRKMLWLQFRPVSATQATGNSSIVFSLNAAALALRPFTLIRSHFQCLVQSDQAAAVEAQNVAFGLAVVSDEAVAAGAAAVPTPLLQMGSSLWFAHQLMMTMDSRTVDLSKPAGIINIDSKAARKVDVGSDIIVVLENESIGGSGGSITFVGGRILVKTN